MPYHYFTEIWTPLRLIGVKLLRDSDGKYWVKIWGFTRRKL